MENETNSCDKQEIFKKNWNEKKRCDICKIKVVKVNNPLCNDLLQFTEKINSIKTPTNSCLSSPYTDRIINSKYLLNIEDYHLSGTVDFSLLDSDKNLKE